MCKQVPWTMEVYEALDLLTIKLMASAIISPYEKGQRNLFRCFGFQGVTSFVRVLHLKTFRTANRLEMPCLLGVLCQTWGSFRLLNPKFSCLCLPVIFSFSCYSGFLDLIFCVCIKAYVQERAWSPDCRFLWAAEAASSPFRSHSVRKRDKDLFSSPQHASPQRLPPRILMCWEHQE